MAAAPRHGKSGLPTSPRYAPIPKMHPPILTLSLRTPLTLYKLCSSGHFFHPLFKPLMSGEKRTFSAIFALGNSKEKAYDIPLRLLQDTPYFHHLIRHPDAEQRAEFHAQAESARARKGRRALKHAEKKKLDAAERAIERAIEREQGRKMSSHSFRAASERLAGMVKSVSAVWLQEALANADIELYTNTHEYVRCYHELGLQTDTHHPMPLIIVKEGQRAKDAVATYRRSIRNSLVSNLQGKRNSGDKPAPEAIVNTIASIPVCLTLQHLLKDDVFRNAIVEQLQRPVGITARDMEDAHENPAASPNFQFAVRSGQAVYVPQAMASGGYEHARFYGRYINSEGADVTDAFLTRMAEGGVDMAPKATAKNTVHIKGTGAGSEDAPAGAVSLLDFVRVIGIPRPRSKDTQAYGVESEGTEDLWAEEGEWEDRMDAEAYEVESTCSHDSAGSALSAMSELSDGDAASVASASVEEAAPADLDAQGYVEDVTAAVPACDLEAAMSGGPLDAGRAIAPRKSRSRSKSRSKSRGRGKKKAARSKSPKASHRSKSRSKSRGRARKKKPDGRRASGFVLFHKSLRAGGAHSARYQQEIARQARAAPDAAVVTHMSKAASAIWKGVLTKAQRESWNSRAAQ